LLSRVERKAPNPQPQVGPRVVDDSSDTQEALMTVHRQEHPRKTAKA